MPPPAWSPCAPPCRTRTRLLWPGTLVKTKLTLRNEEPSSVPSAAVQVSQTGNFVFVVKDGVAKVQPVKVERTVGRACR